MWYLVVNATSYKCICGDESIHILFTARIYCSNLTVKCTQILKSLNFCFFTDHRRNEQVAINIQLHTFITVNAQLVIRTTWHYYKNQYGYSIRHVLISHSNKGMFRTNFFKLFLQTIYFASIMCGGVFLFLSTFSISNHCTGLVISKFCNPLQVAVGGKIIVYVYGT